MVGTRALRAPRLFGRAGPMGPAPRKPLLISAEGQPPARAADSRSTTVRSTPCANAVRPVTGWHGETGTQTPRGLYLSRARRGGGKALPTLPLSATDQ